MSGVSSIKDIGDVQDELHDRYGDPPKPVWNALEVLRVRLAARQIGLAAIRYENKAITLRFGSGVHFTPQGLAFLATVYRDYRLAADAVIIPLKSAEVLREVERMVKAVARALQHGGKQVARRGGKTQ